MWELTTIPKRPDAQNYGLISSQVKKGNIVNLRPFTFYKNEEKKIKSMKDFLIQIGKTINHFKSQLIKNNTPYSDEVEWYNKVVIKYQEQTGETI